MKLRRFLVLTTSVLCLSQPASRAADVMVFAAASLSDVLKEAAAAHQQQSGDRAIFNLGASSMLARQIAEGAPADIFFSADEAKMDGLEERGLILKETRQSLLSNSLVVVTGAGNETGIQSPSDLAGPKVKRIALADPKAVPAGVYAKAYLKKQRLWTAVESKVVPTDNVRAALAAVESGNVEAGIVYKTDAAISKKVKVAFEVPSSEGPQISYPVAAVKDSSRIEAAKRFLQYLNSDDAAKIFEKHGFVVLR